MNHPVTVPGITGAPWQARPLEGAQDAVLLLRGSEDAQPLKIWPAADGHLMAAAGALYDACEDAEAYIDSFGSSQDPAVQVLLHNLREAMRKARGEETTT